MKTLNKKANYPFTYGDKNADERDFIRQAKIKLYRKNFKFFVIMPTLLGFDKYPRESFLLKKSATIEF